VIPRAQAPTQDPAQASTQAAPQGQAQSPQAGAQPGRRPISLAPVNNTVTNPEVGRQRPKLSVRDEAAWSELERKAAELDRRRDARSQAQDRNTDPNTRRRGPEQIAQRLINELRRGGSLTHQEASAALRVTEKLMERGYLDNLAVSVSNVEKGGGVRGEYNPVTELVKMFVRNTNRPGIFKRTFAHEVSHHLERMVPAKDLEAARQQFLRERAKWLKDKGALRQLLGEGNWLDKSFTNAQIKQFLGNNTMDASLISKYFIKDTNTGKWRLKLTDETYKFTNFSEYFAERVSEIAGDRDDARLNPQDGPRVWNKIKDMLAQIKKALIDVFGKDKVEAIWDKFQDGEYTSDFKRDKLAGYDKTGGQNQIMDDPRTADYRDKRFGPADQDRQTRVDNIDKLEPNRPLSARDEDLAPFTQQELRQARNNVQPSSVTNYDVTIDATNKKGKREQSVIAVQADSVADAKRRAVVSAEKNGLTVHKVADVNQVSKFPMVNLKGEKPSVGTKVTQTPSTPEGWDRLHGSVDRSIGFANTLPDLGLSENWGQVLSLALPGGTGDLPPAPLRLHEWASNPAKFKEFFDSAMKENPDLISSAVEGLGSLAPVHQMAMQGKIPTRMVAMHFLWGVLSKQLTPFEQEAGWIKLTNNPKVLAAIEDSIAGRFSMDLDTWVGLVQESIKGPGLKAGNQSTSNSNAFHLTLRKWNGRWDELAGIINNKDLSGPQMRRAIYRSGMGAGSGFGYKVMSFNLLTLARRDMFIGDRWQFVNLWFPHLELTAGPDGVFYYNKGGVPEDRTRAYKSLNTLDKEASAEAVYALIENGMQKIADANRSWLEPILGHRPMASDIHWLSWNIIKKEPVGHSSLDSSTRALQEGIYEQTDFTEAFPDVPKSTERYVGDGRYEVFGGNRKALGYSERRSVEGDAGLRPADPANDAGRGEAGPEGLADGRDGSEGVAQSARDDGENTPIPGGYREAFFQAKKGAGAPEPKQIKFWTDLGHDPDADQTKQFLWSIDRRGQVHVISVSDLNDKMTAAGASLDNAIEAGPSDGLSEWTRIPTHLDWETLGGEYDRSTGKDLGIPQDVLSGPAHGRIDATGDVLRVSLIQKNQSTPEIKADMQRHVKEKLGEAMGEDPMGLRGYDFTDAGPFTGPEVFSARDEEPGNAEPVFTPGGEPANHNDLDLARRGFITREATKMPADLAGVKLVIKQDKAYGDYSYYKGELRFGGRKIAEFNYSTNTEYDDVPLDLEWIEVQKKHRNKELSKVIQAEIIERSKRADKPSSTYYATVVDPKQRPISGMQSLLGKENVEVTDVGYEQTDGRDQFRVPMGDGTFIKERREVEAKIPQYTPEQRQLIKDIKAAKADGDIAKARGLKNRLDRSVAESGTQILSARDDGENMRIPGGARDQFLDAKERQVKVFKEYGYMTLGHGIDTFGDPVDKNGAWKKKAHMFIVDADGMVRVSDTIASEEAKFVGRLKNEWPQKASEFTDILKQTPSANVINHRSVYRGLPALAVKGRVEIRGDTAYVSVINNGSQGEDSQTDRQNRLNHIRGTVAEKLGITDVRIVDMSTTKNAQSARDDDGENTPIPGGKREQFLKKKPVPRPTYYTDIGHDPAKAKDSYLFMMTYDGMVVKRVSDLMQDVKDNLTLGSRGAYEMEGKTYGFNINELTHNDWEDMDSRFGDGSVKYEAPTAIAFGRIEVKDGKPYIALGSRGDESDSIVQDEGRKGLRAMIKAAAQEAVDRGEITNVSQGITGFDYSFVDGGEGGQPAVFSARDDDGDYRGSHRAPDGTNGEGSLDAMDRTYPEDIYGPKGAQYYGARRPDDVKIHKLIQSVRGNPDAKVTVYRAVPKGVGAEITPGNWVSPSREYAAEHGERFPNGYDVLERQVRAGDLFTEGNSLQEFGWNPTGEPIQSARDEEAPRKLKADPVVRGNPRADLDRPMSQRTATYPKGEDFTREGRDGSVEAYNILGRNKASPERMRQIQEFVKDSGVKHALYRGQMGAYETPSAMLSEDGLTHLAQDPDYAAQYAESTGKSVPDSGSKSSVVQVYLNAKNIVDISDVGHSTMSIRQRDALRKKDPSGLEANEAMADRSAQILDKIISEVARINNVSVESLSDLRDSIQSDMDFVEQNDDNYPFVNSVWQYFSHLDTLFKDYGVEAIKYSDSDRRTARGSTIGGKVSYAVKDTSLIKAAFGDNDVNPDTGNIFQSARDEETPSTGSARKAGLVAGALALAPTSVEAATGAAKAAGATIAGIAVGDLISVASGIAFTSSDRLLKGLNPIAANMHLLANDTRSKTMKRVAEMFNRLGGNTDAGAQETYHEERDANRRIFRNKLADAFEPLAKLSQDQIRALDITIARALAGEIPMPSGPVGQVVQNLQALSDELYTYLRQSGLELNYAQGYAIPHSFNAEAVAKDEQAFIDTAEQAYIDNNPKRIRSLQKYIQQIDQEAAQNGGFTQEMTDRKNAMLEEIKKLQVANPRQQAEDLAAAILSGAEGGDQSQGLILASNPRNQNRADFLKSRVFEHSARAMLREYFHNDPRHAWNNYIARATTLAEFSRRFGADGQTWNSMVEQMRKEGVKEVDITRIKEMVLDAMGALTPAAQGSHAMANALLGLSNMSKLKSTFLTNFLEAQAQAIPGNLLTAVTAPVVMLKEFAAILVELSPRQRALLKQFLRVDLNSETGNMELARITGLMDSAGVHNIMENSAYALDNKADFREDSRTDRAARKISNATGRMAQAYGIEASENAKRAMGARYAAGRLDQHVSEFLRDNILARALKKVGYKGDAMTTRNEAIMRLRRAGVNDANMIAFGTWWEKARFSGKFNEMLADTTDPMAAMARKAIRMESARAMVNSNRAMKPGGERNKAISQDNFWGKAVMSFLNYPAAFREQIAKPMARDIASGFKGYESEGGQSTFFSPAERARMIARASAIPAMAVSAAAFLALRVLALGDEEDEEELKKKTLLNHMIDGLSYTGLTGGKTEAIQRARRGQLPPIIDEGVRLGKNFEREATKANGKERAITKSLTRSVAVPATQAVVSTYAPAPIATVVDQALASKAFNELVVDTVAGKEAQKKKASSDPRTGSRESGRSSGRTDGR
jgi:hypothetical protein